MLCGSFESSDDIICLDLVRRLFDINFDNDLEYFECLLSLSKSSECGLPIASSKFTAESIEKSVLLGKEFPSRFYISGSVKFAKGITGSLKSANIPSHSIYFI